MDRGSHEKKKKKKREGKDEKKKDEVSGSCLKKRKGKSCSGVFVLGASLLGVISLSRCSILFSFFDLQIISFLLSSPFGKFLRLFEF